MSTRKNNIPVVPDTLIIEKADFASKLNERIELGKNIIDEDAWGERELEAIEKQYSKWNAYNLEYLKNSFNNELNAYLRNYSTGNNIDFYSGARQISVRIKEANRKIQDKIDKLESLLDRIDLLKTESRIMVNSESPISKTTDVNKIFIVHGHNTSFQQSTARALERLGLTPIILQEQPNTGQTILEKFERHADVNFAIVLLTDDDEGRKKSDFDLKNRARQNVVLELGYFIGKLGRSRVLTLYVEGVELPSDLYGLLHTKLDESDHWKSSLIRELKSAGYEIDANQLF